MEPQMKPSRVNFVHNALIGINARSRIRIGRPSGSTINR